MNGKKRRPNFSEIAYEEIKEMILFGELAQGERILLDEVSDTLNLSITPIREALNKLAQEDLITITPRTSYEVVSLNAEDIRDILELRILLETFALQTAGEYFSRFPVQMFREMFQKSYSIHTYKDFLATDVRFHSTIVATSTNKKLGKLYDYIHNLIRVVLVPAAQIEGRIEMAVKEHLAILEAIETQNLDLALERLTSHLDRVESLLLHTYEEKEPA